MTRTFPKIFQACEILPIDQYPLELIQILRSPASRGDVDPTAVLRGARLTGQGAGSTSRPYYHRVFTTL